MGTKLFMVEEIRTVVEVDEEDKSTTTFGLFRMPGSEKEWRWSELPAGAVHVLKNGHLLIRIWVDKAETVVGSFHPQIEGTPGKGWTVEGIPPNITCDPSVFVSPPDGWHGFIKSGELVKV